MVESRPVQTSAVYVLGQTAFPAEPPLSPPSPISPQDTGLCTPIEELCLDDAAHSAPARLDLGHRDQRLAGAVHVLHTEATALAGLAKLYSQDPVARDGFHRAVDAITQTGQKHPGAGPGKLVFIGVGKSGHIAKKLVATFNSLAIQSSFLHPTEALHGDLGQIGPNDTIVMVTFSGKTQELLLLLPHIHKSHPLLLLTAHTHPGTCELIRQRPDIILLPTPIHESETVSFGVNAPTTSTTAALALGDALALVASQELHSSVSAVFAKNHPGGAIGAVFKSKPARVATLSVSWANIPMLPTGTSDSPVIGADVLRAGYASASGWVRVVDGVISPSRIRQLSSADLSTAINDLAYFVTKQGDFISLSGDLSIQRASDMIQEIKDGNDLELPCKEDSVVAVFEEGECVGVFEAGALLAAAV